MPDSISPENFERIIDGNSVRLYTLENKTGVKAVFSNFGQRLIALYVPDKNGNLKDVVLGCSSLEGYSQKGAAYFGATIGRYGNRIANGKFSIDEVTFQLPQNHGANHIHGGFKGFDSVVWQVEYYSREEIEFSRVSLDAEEGYPGNLKVNVKYKLTAEGELRIVYEAKTDQKTIINLTHHSFFNLNGEGQGTIEDHIVEINANQFTPIDENLIPTGVIESVLGTPMDFTTPKKIKDDIDSDFAQLKRAGGFDHNYVINPEPISHEGLRFAAKVFEPNSGRIMEVYTNEPGVQFYAGNFLDGSIKGKGGNPYIKRGGFCLETQHFPNSPNQPNFPSTILKPGETYSSICIYKFGVKE